MGRLRLPRISDFDDPRLIPQVIEPLREEAKTKSNADVADDLLFAIYNYVNYRCRDHAYRLGRRGITNISHENISSEVNNRLARSMQYMDWTRSAREIRGYIIQQINYGLKEADRISGKRSRREHRHINKAAIIVSKQEQEEGRTLTRNEIEKIVNGVVSDTNKTQWSGIALNALDPKEGPTKGTLLGQDVAMDVHAGNVVGVDTSSSAEESCFMAFRMEGLTRILQEWMECDLSDESREDMVGWLSEQNAPQRRTERLQRSAPPRGLTNLRPAEKKRLFDRCSEAGFENMDDILGRNALGEVDLVELRDVGISIFSHKKDPRNWEIVEVAPYSMADACGILPGDRIASIGRAAVATTEMLTQVITKAAKKGVELTLNLTRADGTCDKTAFLYWWVIAPQTYLPLSFLRAGDMLISIGGKPCRTPERVASLLDAGAVTQEVIYRRNGSMVTTHVTCVDGNWVESAVLPFLRAGDLLVSIDGNPYSGAEGVTQLLNTGTGTREVAYLRNEKTFTTYAMCLNGKWVECEKNAQPQMFDSESPREDVRVEGVRVNA